MPYKHIAAHLKKTELACRLHYHQLSHGSNRRKRSGSVASSAETVSHSPIMSQSMPSPINENGHAQTPLLWTSKSGTAYSDALSRIIKNGSDPATEIKAVKAIVDAELKRIAS